MGLTTAKDIYSKLEEALDLAQLPWSKLLMLSKHGPNVNKAATKLSYFEKQPVGTCNIHLVHNMFHRGLAQLGNNASNLIFLHNGRIS